jgi:hypothetical protein
LLVDSAFAFLAGLFKQEVWSYISEEKKDEHIIKKTSQGFQTHVPDSDSGDMLAGRASGKGGYKPAELGG